MFSQRETGLLDMDIMTAALTSQREPSIVGWFRPFLFDSVEEVAQTTETEAAQQMLTNRMPGPAHSAKLGHHAGPTACPANHPPPEMTRR